MKKVISILLSVTIVFMLFAGCTSSNSEGEIPNDESDNKLVTEELPTEPAHKTEVPDGYVGIYSVDDFEYIRTTPKGNYILMSDIDFSNTKDWDRVEVKGDFDGNNYSINNYHQKRALFSECSGSIKDLTMSNSSGKNGSPFCNELYAGTLTNIKINADITVELTTMKYEDVIMHSSDYEPSVCIGGIVDTAYRGSDDYEPNIASCSFKGDITVNYKQIQERSQTEQDVSVGGIVGYSNHCNVSNCIAAGNITYKEQGNKAIIEENGYNTIFHQVYLGGIVADTTVSKVYNTANNIDIKATTNCAVYAGGIIGNSDVIGDGPQIAQCCNSGDIELKSRDTDVCQAGGICARADSYLPVITDCYNSGSIAAQEVAGISVNSAVISKCYNKGKLSGSKATGSLLVNKSESVEYSYYLDAGFPAIYDGGKYPTVKALSSEAMQNQESYEGFDFEDVWTMGTDNYPTLSHTLTQ